MFRLVCGNTVVHCSTETALNFRKFMPLIVNHIDSIVLPSYMSHVDVTTLMVYADEYDSHDTLTVNYPVMVLKVAYELELIRDDMMEMLIAHAIDHISTYKEFKDVLMVVSNTDYEQECNTFELYQKAVSLAVSGAWRSEVLSVKHRDQLVRHVMKYAEAEYIVPQCDSIIRNTNVPATPPKSKSAAPHHNGAAMHHNGAAMHHNGAAMTV